MRRHCCACAQCTHCCAGPKCSCAPALQVDTSTELCPHWAVIAQLLVTLVPGFLCTASVVRTPCVGVEGVVNTRDAATGGARPRSLTDEDVVVHAPKNGCGTGHERNPPGCLPTGIVAGHVKV